MSKMQMCFWRGMTGLILGLGLLLGNGRVAAQTPVEDVAHIEIAQVDNSAYPQVTVYVRVTDAYGERVDGLDQENFQISEDGQGVTITSFSGVNPEPIRTLLLIDKSGSMEIEGKLEGAKSAALIFIDQLREQDQAAIIAFDNGVNLIQDFTTDKAALGSKVQSLTTGDCTSWYEAVYIAADITAPLSGRKSLILLSDGMDCREDWWLHELQGYGSYHSFEEAVDKIQKAETPVYSIALGREPAENLGAEGYDEGRLTRIAQQTGGQYYHSPTADQLAELYQTLARQTQQEYVLTYESPRPSYDGTRRDIQVSVVEAGADAESPEVTAVSTYLEEHLLNIESDWLVGGILLIPLILAALVPGFVRGRRTQSSSQPGAFPPSAGAACIRCGSPLRPGAKFCAQCGTSQEQIPPQPVVPSPIFCQHCGGPMPAGARFCTRCGNQR